jgi:hypothetical protein
VREPINARTHRAVLDGRDAWKARALAAEAALAEARRDAGLSQAARDVLAERARQVSVEGWTPAHDDAHDNGCLGTAAACYALHASSQSDPVEGWQEEYRHKAARLWPFDAEWYKPTTPRRDLEKAGALILAEMERLDRVPKWRDETAAERDEDGRR